MPCWRGEVFATQLDSIQLFMDPWRRQTMKTFAKGNLDNKWEENILLQNSN